MGMRRKVVVTVEGPKDNYWRFTISWWLREIKEIIEREYGIELIIEEVDGEGEFPTIYVDGEPVMTGMPGEEGYLIEVLKVFLNRYLSK